MSKEKKGVGRTIVDTAVGMAVEHYIEPIIDKLVDKLSGIGMPDVNDSNQKKLIKNKAQKNKRKLNSIKNVKFKHETKKPVSRSKKEIKKRAEQAVRRVLGKRILSSKLSPAAKTKQEIKERAEQAVKRILNKN